VISRSVNELVFVKIADPWYKRVWIWLRRKPSNTFYVIQRLEFACIKEIKVGGKFKLKNVIFQVESSEYLFMDHQWHIKATSCTSVKRKPQKRDFSYSPIERIYGEDPVHT